MNVIIIGATSGIGRSLVARYAVKGNRIGIIGRRQELLRKIEAQYSPGIIVATIAADVTIQDEIRHALSVFQNEMKTIDLAVVCAGVGELNPELDFALEEPTIMTNVLGWTYAVDTLYNMLSQQGNGHLAAITSVGGLRGEPAAPAYSASKAYQINYMEALGKKAFKDGGHIQITDIRPGLVDTRMAKGDNLFWVMPTDKVAGQIVDAIKRKRSKMYVTKRWGMLAAIIRNLPFFLYKRM